MDEQPYRVIIYGLKLKMKRLEEMMCDDLMNRSRARRIGIYEDIDALIKDFEDPNT